MNFNMTRFPTVRPLAVYHSVMTKDRRITLPKECLADMDLADDGSYPVVLSNSLEENMIFICTKKRFEVIKESLQSVNLLDPNIRRIKRRVWGEAEEARIDKRRRIRICSKFTATLDINGCGSFPVTLLKYPEVIKIVSSEGFEEPEYDYDISEVYYW